MGRGISVVFALFSNRCAGSMLLAMLEKSYEAADSRKRALSAAVWKRMTGGARDGRSDADYVCCVIMICITTVDKREKNHEERILKFAYEITRDGSMNKGVMEDVKQEEGKKSCPLSPLIRASERATRLDSELLRRWAKRRRNSDLEERRPRILWRSGPRNGCLWSRMLSVLLGRRGKRT